MQDYIARWEQMSVKVASIDACIDEGLLCTTFVEVFGVRSYSPSGTALFAPPRKDDLTCQPSTLRFYKTSRCKKCQG